MKRFFGNFTAFILVVAMTATMAVVAYANANISVIVEGQQVEFADQAPVIVNGRTLIPVRGVFEQLGFTVNWNNDARQATLTNSNYTVVLTVGSETFTINGANRVLDVPAQLIGGRTMLPLRGVLENVGYYVSWNSGTNTVLISAEPIPAQPTPTPTPPPTTAPTIEEGRVRFNNGGVTNELLAEMIATGEIPADVTSLNLFGNQITDLTPLSGLTNLTQLFVGGRMSGTQISDLTPLNGLTNLTVLHLSENQISDLTPLSGLTNLTELHLNDNQITDLTPLSGLMNLTDLRLWGNQITDLTPLSSLTNLTWLWLGGNPITDLTPLSGLAKLTQLHLEGNQITDLTPLSGLTNLTQLSLGGNPITDLTPLSGLANLRQLNLGEQLYLTTDLSPVAHVENVTNK